MNHALLAKLALHTGTCCDTPAPSRVDLLLASNTALMENALVHCKGPLRLCGVLHGRLSSVCASLQQCHAMAHV